MRASKLLALVALASGCLAAPPGDDGVASSAQALAAPGALNSFKRLRFAAANTASTSFNELCEPSLSKSATQAAGWQVTFIYPFAGGTLCPTDDRAIIGLADLWATGGYCIGDPYPGPYWLCDEDADCPGGSCGPRLGANDLQRLMRASWPITFQLWKGDLHVATTPSTFPAGGGGVRFEYVNDPSAGGMIGCCDYTYQAFLGLSSVERQPGDQCFSKLYMGVIPTGLSAGDYELHTLFGDYDSWDPAYPVIVSVGDQFCP